MRTWGVNQTKTDHPADDRAELMAQEEARKLLIINILQAFLE